MIKEVSNLQTLDFEVGILLELHGSYASKTLLIQDLKDSFNKVYVEEDLENLKRYHDFINTRGEFEDMCEFKLNWYEDNVR